MNSLKSQLLEFGLSEKEASVYLAMLELGPSSVQDIAKKAGVNRATTYVMLESLKRRGLMSSVDRGKKTMFAAESPEHLLSSVSLEVRAVEEKKSRLASAMPQFMALFNAIEHKPKVRYFEGEEGFRACREAQIEMSKPGQLVRSFMHFDSHTIELSKVAEDKRLVLTRGAYSVRGLYSIEPGIELPVVGKNVEMRRIPNEIAPFKGEISIFEDFLLLAVLQPKPIAVIIESGELAQLSRSMFDMAWRCTEKPT